MLVVSSETFGCDLPFLVSRNWCRDLNSMSSSLHLGHIFSFMLRHPSVVLNFQAGRDSKLLVCLFSYRDMDIRSQPSIFFNHFNSFRNLKSMSRPSFLPILLQPHFSVSTVSFNFSISGHDLTVLLIRATVG